MSPKTPAVPSPSASPPAKGLVQSDLASLRAQFGYNEVLEKKPNPVLLFAKKFWGLTAWLLEIIIGLSWFLHKFADVYTVLGLLIFNAVIGFTQEHNAAKAVAALKKKLQINVKLLRDGQWTTRAARELLPGDVVRVRSGDFVPADVQLTQGAVRLDQAALTGESGAVAKKVGDTLYSGSIVTKGEATGTVTLTGPRTYYGKTIALVNTAQPQSHIEAVVGSVTRWLLAIVGTLLAVALGVAVSKGLHVLQLMPLLLVLLLGAVPVALGALFTVSMALASRQLVAQGVLVTRLSAPDDAASMDVLCVDKTGTLTLNQLTVGTVQPADGFGADDVLRLGALASQEADHDAIDLAFIAAARQKSLLDSTFVQKTFVPFDPQTRRTEAQIQHGPATFLVLKGAFASLAAACGLDAAATAAWAAKVAAAARQGYRTLAVATATGAAPPRLVGLADLHDAPRPDSRQLVQELKSLGVAVKMLTGDARPIAIQIATAVGVGGAIIQAADLKKADPAQVAALLEKNDGVAGVYPEDKYDIVKALQAGSHIVGMTGDGVNDAPALKQAEVGIAVRSATDVAKGAASVVLTQDGLVSILEPIKVGRMMFERINTWILNKLARTILKTCFVVGAFLVLGKFVISAAAMLLLIFMTDFVKISLATDHVQWAPQPARWNIRGLAKTGIVIGLAMTLEAFGLLYLGLRYFRLGAGSAALSTFCFELLLFFALFSIFVVREKSHFWHSAPSRTLLLLLLADMVLGLALATFGLLGFQAIPLTQSVAVIAYTAVCSFVINDLLKVAVSRPAPAAGPPPPAV
ncbi:plasma-membrane proton-efflux P-type ATPase [Hymenobacter caeli]|uniref:plasma-membrane proton-efflux P-type ATPase n=1 Tax=Hymenobacter caeli TaxID=2735894 RepID=UPI001FE4CFFD|nr:plasma-membrane proton-efflux P-type ATPase [Hymenobacter caeli]